MFTNSIRQNTVSQKWQRSNHTLAHQQTLEHKTPTQKRSSVSQSLLSGVVWAMLILSD
jgi:hypothetical protein